MRLVETCGRPSLVSPVATRKDGRTSASRYPLLTSSTEVHLPLAQQAWLFKYIDSCKDHCLDSQASSTYKVILKQRLSGTWMAEDHSACRGD